MTIQKKFVLMSVILAVLFVVAGCGGGANPQETASQPPAPSNNTGSEQPSGEQKETITLKLATDMSTESIGYTDIMKPYMDRVTELTGGQVQFDFYPNGQLGKAADLVSLTSTGVADISLIYPTYNPSEMPLTSVLIGMPGLYKTSYGGSAAYWEVANQSPMLDTDYLKNGVRPIQVNANPQVELLTKGTEIKVPDDLKGKRVRSPGGVPSEALQLIGSTPVSIPAADLYTSFDRDVIDAVGIALIGATSFGIDEMTKFTTTNISLGATNTVLIINENLYQGLPQEVQEALMQAGEEVSISSGHSYDEANNATYEAWKTEGKTVREFTADEQAKWDQFYNDFATYWIEKQNSEDFKKVYEQFKGIVEEIEK